jgi:uncharacterized protein (TIGR02147 family)
LLFNNIYPAKIYRRTNLEEPSIFNYTEYRKYLKDMFEFKKARHDQFSYRYFSNKAGFSSSNFLMLVIQGKKNLTHESIAKMCKGFEIKGKDREYFENMVLMNQAKNIDEKKRYYFKMISNKKVSPEIKKLEKANFDYFTKWYLPVLRELCEFSNGQLNSDEMSRMLNPQVSQKDVERGLEILMDMGLIKKDENGIWSKCDKAISTGPIFASFIIASFHKYMIRLGHEAIDRYEKSDRDISARTLSISKTKFEELKIRIERFRREILESCCDDSDSDQVVQLNFQLFPLTKKL